MDLTTIFQALNDGATALTPNLRLSQYWQSTFATWAHQQRGPKVWLAPDILPLSAWCQRVWEQASQTHALPLLLSDAQETYLWTLVIESNTSEQPLLNPLATAQAVQQAWRLIQDWGLPWQSEAFAQTPDQACLQRWARQFCQRCDELNVIESARMLPTSLKKFRTAPTKSLILLNFTETTPQHQALWQYLESSGCSILRYEGPIEKAECLSYTFSDKESEYAAMVDWACRQRKDGAKAIACVIPDLKEMKPQLRRRFETALHGQHPFNISLGDPLSSYPVVEAALTALGLTGATLPIQELSTFLRSPFLGDAESELGARALLDAECLATEQSQISRQALISMARVQAPKLAERFERANAPSASRSARAWGAYFAQTLMELGWPGERILSSEEYQQVARWQQLLIEFMQIEHLSKSMTAAHALSTLKVMSRQTVFQAQSTPGTVIHVLGLLEAMSLPFDAIWLASCDDTAWPAPASPNPYIPFSWQRDHDMPHATADRELSFSQGLLNEFQSQCGVLIASYSTQVGEFKRRPSQLIAAFEPSNYGDVPAPAPFTHVQLEPLLDTLAPPITETSIRGGSYILREQAACPFRAFARSRLEAAPLGSQTLGLSALDRGTLLHAVLEAFWRCVPDSATLNAFTPDQELQLIQHAIRESCTNLSDDNFELESIRLTRLMQRWLAIEKERLAFRVVGTEISANLELNQRRLTLRIDRIDELPDGSKVVIDYKSGLTSPQNWFGDRPQEPQLPLYTLTDPTIRGLAYAQIRADKPKFSGVAASEQGEWTAVESMNEGMGWETQQTLWHKQLSALLNDYCSGVASVTPYYPPETCSHCECISLCRIGEKV